MEAFEFRVLGPFQVRRGDELVAEGGGKRRALLAVLLLSSNRAVSPARLIECLWGDEPPGSATNLVQGYVSDWRGVLDPGRARRSSGERVLSTGAGYLLRVAPQELDLLRFTRLAHQARLAMVSEDLAGARRLLHDAVAERQGTALADFAGTPLDPAAASLEEDWLAVVEHAADVELRLGCPQQALAYLEGPVHDHPLRESLTALRMRSLYQLGRQSDALAAYEAVRAALAAELGVDPAPRLRQLHLDILRQAPALEPSAGSVRPPRLPGRVSSFVGRSQDLVGIVALLAEQRLVTLTGPGGSGKTRLAVEVAAEVAAHGDREVAFVDLAPAQDADLMALAIAGALGQPLSAAAEPLGAVATLLSSRPVLLVLDNLEGLVGTAALVATLLRLAPGLRILATSREPLGVSGEQRWTVPPLATPAQEDEADPAAVLESEAVRLFVDRARACDPQFTVADHDTPVVARIVRRLDGLPLTVELAAPWVTILSLRSLLERLDRPLALLADHSGTDRPDRHRSLRAALEWSYAALTDEQRRLLDQMSVFVSGARLEAVEAVADPGGATLLRLAELVGKNLVTRAGPAQLPRYRLLETIREYAGERLASRPDERRIVRDRHAAYFCALAESVARAARTRRGDELTSRLEEEHDEIRATLEHLRANGATRRRLTLLVDCLPLWWDLGHVREGYELLVDAIADVGELSDELSCSAHLAATVLAEASGQPEAALVSARSARAKASRDAAPCLEALSRCLEGNILSWMDSTGDAAEGIAMLEEARRLAEVTSRDPARRGWSSRAAVSTTAALSLVDVLRYRDNAQAQHVLASLTVARAGETDRHTESFILRASGALAADAGEWARAEQLLGESLVTATGFPSGRSESRSREELARLAWAQGDLVSAAGLAEQAMSMARDAGHALNWARCAALRADVALQEHDHQRATALLDDADTALGRGNPALAKQHVHPRRARLSRLQGSPVLAAHHLDVASSLEHASGLTPDRVIYLIELATLAADRGDAARAAQVVGVLRDAARRVGISLPRPEHDRLDGLRLIA